MSPDYPGEIPAVIICGHRGLGSTDSAFAISQKASRTRPAENTLLSFQAAIDAGANAIETDLVATKDGQVVLTHSSDLRQHVPAALLPEGSPFIDQWTLSQMQAFEGTAKIPALPALLALARQANSDFFLNLELKDVQGTDRPRRPHPSIAELALQEVKKSGFPLENIRFSSFSLDIMGELKRLAPAARVGMLFDLSMQAGAGKKIFGHPDYAETYLSFTPDAVEETLHRVPGIEALHPEIRTLTPEMASLAARHKLAIATWAWQEKSPLATDGVVFARATKNAIALCREYVIPLMLITDYIADMKVFIETTRLTDQSLNS